MSETCRRWHPLFGACELSHPHPGLMHSRIPGGSTSPNTWTDEEAQEQERVDATGSGCWLAHYGDWSGIAVFADELDALRYAVEKKMDIKFVPWGEIR